MTIEKLATNYREVTATEFGDFLNAKKISPQCPCCGELSAINVKGDGELVSPLACPIVSIADGKFTDGESSMITASVSCRNCGYMRNFTYSAILKWLDKEQQQDRVADE